MTNRSFVLRFVCVSLLICACILGWSQANTSPTQGDLTGTWQGTLGAGNVKLRLVLTFTKSGNGQYNAIVESVDQGGAIFPADKVTLEGAKLRMEFARINGIYEGTVSKDGSEIAGTWTQGALPQPLSFKRGAASGPSADAGQKDAKPATPPQKPLTVPVDVSVPQAPTAFQADAKTHLVYELHITNYSGQTVALAHLEVVDEKGTELARLGQTELLSSVRIIGTPEATGTDKLNLPGGKTALVYMWITLANPAAIPAALEHTLSVKVGTYPDEISIRCAHVAVGHHDLAVVSAPLRGDNWLAANGPSNASAHRRAIIPIDGRARIAQRFAIDWVRVNADGQTTYTGDPLDNKNYRAYGSEALAVADGTVVATKDGIPQNIPGENSRAVPITLETVGGNHVVLDIGHGRFAFYAHLQPGSLKVKIGDHVKRGQVLGLVGNSGNSTEPHLHFHVGDSISPLGSEGLPYALDSFDTKAKSGAVTKHKQEIPLEDESVTFAK